MLVVLLQCIPLVNPRMLLLGIIAVMWVIFRYCLTFDIEILRPCYDLVIFCILTDCYTYRDNVISCLTPVMQVGFDHKGLTNGSHLCRFLHNL